MGGERRLRLEVLAPNSNGRGTGSPGRSRKSRYFRAAELDTCCSCEGKQEKELEREMGLAFVDLLRHFVELGL